MIGASVRKFLNVVVPRRGRLGYGYERTVEVSIVFAQWFALLLAPVWRLTKNLSSSYPAGCPAQLHG